MFLIIASWNKELFLMINGPCVIFTSANDPELIEEKEQNIIKKGEKENEDKKL